MQIPTPSIFTSVINGYLPEPHASLLNGIIFGTPLRTTQEFYEALRNLGLLHIVVLSGMNITILCLIVGSMTAMLPKKASLLVSCVAIVAFVLFVGIEPPILRAAVMGILSLFAVLTGRKATSLYLLLISFVVALIFFPTSVTTVSFQLSYGATLGLILFARPLSSGETNPARLASSELRTSFAAQIFTAPIIFFYFRQFSVIAPVSNLFVAWIITPIMIFGLLTAVLGKIHVSLGLIPAFISYILLEYIITVVKILSTIPFATVSF